MLCSMHLQVDWKLIRGKWRPRLLDYAKHASDEAVVAATNAAFASLKTSQIPEMQDVRKALKELTSLKASLFPLTVCTTLASFATCMPFRLNIEACHSYSIM